MLLRHSHNKRHQQEAGVTDGGVPSLKTMMAGFLEASHPSCTSCLWNLGDTQKTYPVCPINPPFPHFGLTRKLEIPNVSLSLIQFILLGKQTLTLSCSVTYYLLRGELGLMWWLSGKESACRCRRCGFNTQVRKIPWRRKWQPIQYSCLGNPFKEEPGRL